MVAYLATSAFGHLYRKIDCTAADIGALRKAIYSRTVSIPLGLHNLEEIVLARAASPQAMAAQLRLLLSISNWRVLLKPCGQLLDDDLRAFAAGADARGAFLRGAMQNAVTTGISELLESDGEELNEDFAQALDEVRREQEGIRRGARRISRRMRYAFHAAGKRRRFRGAISSATRRRRRRRSPSAPASARNAGGAAPKRYSRSRASGCGWAWRLSLACALSAEERASRAEEANEIMHAISGAAAADTFVTADARAIPWLGRVAIDGLRTTDLKGFLMQTAQSLGERSE